MSHRGDNVKIKQHLIHPFSTDLLFLYLRFVGFINSDLIELSGMAISYKASVGQEPIQDKQPTQLFSTTITGLLLCFRPCGFIASGNNASNGQWAIHKSQPVQSCCVIATIDWPMNTTKCPSFKNNASASAKLLSTKA